MIKGNTTLNFQTQISQCEEENLETNVESIENQENNTTTKVTEPKPKKRRVQSEKYNKNMILKQIQIDRKAYQEERLRMEKRKVEQMLELEREKIELRKKRNDLLDRRNQLLEKISLNINAQSLSLL